MGCNLVKSSSLASPHKGYQSASKRNESNNKIGTQVDPSPQLIQKCQYILQNIHIQTIQMPIQYLLGINEKTKEELFLAFDARSKELYKVQKPQNLKILYYQQLVYLSQNHIFITGGLNSEFNQIFKLAYLWDSVENTLEQLPDMIEERFSHMSTYFQGRLYMFGGKTTYIENEQDILRTCEFFDLVTLKWCKLPPMPRCRATGYTLIYRDQIYVFGGYTDSLKRSRKIDIYNPVTNQWTVLNYRMHRGLEGGMLVSYQPNEVIFLGGTQRKGRVNDVYVYNLLDATVHFRPRMKFQRSLQGGMLYNGFVYEFGSCDEDNIEYCNISNFQWEIDEKKTIQKFFAPQEVKRCGKSKQPVFVMSQIIPKYICQNTTENVYLFGNDRDPFILEFNMTTGFTISKPVPLQMRLFSYQGGVFIGNHQYILFGGVRDLAEKGQKQCFCYRTDIESAYQLCNMIFDQFSMSHLLLYPYIYSCGGKSTQESLKILKSCQRYNILKNEWEQISSMNFCRTSPILVQMLEKIFCIGGLSDKDQWTTKIEFYNPKLNSWTLANWELASGFEGADFFSQGNNTFILVGGKNASGLSSSVQRLTFSLQENNPQIEQSLVGKTEILGDIGSGKFMHKIYLPRLSDWILIFGGTKDKPITTYNLKINQIAVNEVIEPVIQGFNKELSKLNDSFMQRYLLLRETN